MKPIRAILTIRNNRLMKMREERGFLSQSDFCKASGVRPSIYGQLEGMKKSPFRNNPNGSFGGWRKAVLKISEFYGVLPEYLFPEEVRNLDRVRAEMEVGMEELDSFQSPRLSPGDVLLAKEASDIVEGAMNRLSPREEQIIRMRFGLDDEDSRTFKEIGIDFGLSIERVRQIEARALRKIRDNVPGLDGSEFCA